MQNLQYIVYVIWLRDTALEVRDIWKGTIEHKQPLKEDIHVRKAKWRRMGKSFEGVKEIELDYIIQMNARCSLAILNK